MLTPSVRQLAADELMRLTPLEVTVTNPSGGEGGGLTNIELRASPVPISGTVTANVGTVPVTGSFYPATQPVSIASMPATAVTGTFWPATQPVSGTVAVNGSVAVTGAFYQATQPVSIASMPSTPVTGTFWQTTQPVSGTITANAGSGTFAVSGTFWQATQPVSGPLTDAQLRASPVPISGSLSVGSAESTATGRGRVCTFKTPGRAGTTGQKIFALHNATGSTKVVHINQLAVDLYQTVIKAVTVAPPTVRVHRFTAIPTNGTSLTKVAKDSALSSNASVTAWGDASADGTLSGTALTVTIPASSMLTQEYAPRLITAAGYEMFDRTELLDGKDVVLRALEGIVVFLDYTLATQNPATDIWIVGCDWYEI